MSRRDNQCLAHLKVSYRKHFSPLVNIRINIGTLRGRESNELLLGYPAVYPLVERLRLPYMVQVKSDCCMRNLEAYGKLFRFSCCPPLWTPSGSPYSVHIGGHKETDLQTRISRTMTGGAFTHSIIHSDMTYSTT